jgi:hypothetical protein
VNQDLLLQSLHDSRMCSPLLEPESTRELHEELLPAVGSFDLGTRTGMSKASSGQELHESYLYDSSNVPESDLEAQNRHARPGMFSCNVVWETKFTLHPRLRSGPGKSAFARGVQVN